jgi:7-cyano-7-deazaguanine reductase
MDYGIGDKTYEGRQNHIPALKTPAIESWEFQYPGSNTELTVTIPEFTCVCPKTGLPDFATLIIRYIPDKLCLELKSLKEYILFFREVGIFHEHVVNKMLTDCTQACQPRQMVVEGVFNARGGIQTTAIARFSAGVSVNVSGSFGSGSNSGSSSFGSSSLNT